MVLAGLLAGGSHADGVEAPLALVVSDRWQGLAEIPLPVLRQLYLGRRTRLAGRAVQCLHLPSGSAARSAFTRAVIGRSERTMERYWLRQALSGGPPPPRELEAGRALAWVAGEPGRLGYVVWDGGELPAGVRVVKLVVDGRARGPADPDYPLRLPAPPGS